MIHPGNFHFDCTSSYRSHSSVSFTSWILQQFFCLVVYFTPFLMSPVDHRCPWWVHGFVWYTSLSPWRLPLMFTLDSPLFLWCAHFFFRDASSFVLMSDFPPPVLALYVQSCLSFTLIFIGPVLSANMIHLCKFISSFFFLSFCLFPPRLERVQVFQWTHSACPSLAWRHPWCRADPWLALVYLVGTSPPWAGPSYILPM